MVALMHTAAARVSISLVVLLVGSPLAIAGPLAMHAPKKLLATDATAQISVRKPRKGTLKLLANVGHLSELERASGGRLRATYTPPAKRFPQVAIIVAVSEQDGVFDWISIPIYGSPMVRISSEPRAEVIARIAGAEFGPVRTDRRGRARLKVTVPPGVSRGVTVATDRLGNTKEASLVLGVPPFNRLVAVCPSGGSRLLLFAVSSVGAADANAKFSLSASPGSLGQPVSVAPGVFAVELSAGENVRDAADSQIRAQLTGEHASTASCRAPLPWEPPTRLTTALERAEFVAGSSSLRVTVDLHYTGKRSRKPVKPTFAADFGRVLDLRRISATRFQATWSLPNDLAGRKKASLKVGAEGVRARVASSIQLRPGIPVSLRLRSEMTQVSADGYSRTRISVRVLDAHGNPAEPGRLEAKSKGRVTQFSTAADGEVFAIYVAPRVYELGSDTITVRGIDTGLASSADVTLLPAQRRFLASARAGILSNLGRVSSLMGNVELAVRLPVLGENLLLGVETGYYRSSHEQLADGDVDAMEEQVKVSVWAIPLLARLCYEVKTSVVRLRGGIGVGMLYGRASIKSSTTPLVFERKPRFAVSGLAGVSKRLGGSGRVVLELAYLHSPIDFAELDGNLGGVHVTGGYGLEF